MLLSLVILITGQPKPLSKHDACPVVNLAFSSHGQIRRMPLTILHRYIISLTILIFIFSPHDSWLSTSFFLLLLTIRHIRIILHKQNFKFMNDGFVFAYSCHEFNGNRVEPNNREHIIKYTVSTSLITKWVEGGFFSLKDQISHWVCTCVMFRSKRQVT